MQKDNKIFQNHAPVMAHQSQFRRNRNLILVLMVLLSGTIAFMGAIQSVGADQPSSKGALDPLSAAEEVAGRKQLEGLVIESRVKASTPHRQVVLMLDRHRLSKDKATKMGVSNLEVRQAEGYIYDYDTDRLKRVLINLTADAPEISHPKILEIVQDVQLPLIPSEKERALELIRNDERAWQSLRSEFQKTTGAELSDLADLETKINVFLADAMPDRVNEASSYCGRHRCAQVLLFTHDRTVFEITPIVDLSTESVAQLFWTD